MLTGGKRGASGSQCLSLASQNLGGGAGHQGLRLGGGAAPQTHPTSVFGRPDSPFCCCSSNLFQSVCGWGWGNTCTHWCVCTCLTRLTSSALFTEVGCLSQTQSSLIWLVSPTRSFWGFPCHCLLRLEGQASSPPPTEHLHGL